MIKTIIFDWKRTLYDPDTKSLIDGVLDLLEFIKSKGVPMILIGKGADEMHEEVDRLEVRRYFKNIVFAEGEKDINVFKGFVSTNPKETVFVGDRVRSELEIGNKLGATTIWVKQGRFADEEPQNGQQKPDYTVSSLHECKRQLKSYFLAANVVNLGNG